MKPFPTFPPRAIAVAAFLTAACAAFPAAAFAEDPPMTPPPAPGAPAGETAAPPPVSSRFIDTYDANQDGKVTKEEFTGDAEVFGLLDKDGDGVVTNVELGLPADYRPRPLPPPPPEEGAGMKGGNLQKRLDDFKVKLAEWDANKDGKVTKEEYKGKAPFEILDRNKDGVISMDDMRGGGGGKGMPGAPGMPGGEMMNPEAIAARFKEADKNGDGKVTKEEFPGAPERFAMLDRDGDGAITLEEMTAAMKGAGERGGKRMFQRFDKNGDGKVARDEFPGGDAAFQGMDKNGDGFLTPDEIEAMAGKKPGKFGKPGEPGKPGKPGEPGTPTTPGGPPMGGDGMTPPAPGGLGGLFAALDRDHDGKLSRAEFPGGDDEWRKLDRDGNGWITPDEASPK